MRYLSPLRYPGGKARLAPYLQRLITAQTPRPTHYAEPFAGGAGAALKLLTDGIVEEIHLNDLNPGIAAFWRSITTAPEEFCELISETEVNLDEWRKQRVTYLAGETGNDLALGFATFFLNRTNRSGILHAGPIGGHDQKGKWKIDARYNKPGLVKRVQAIGRLGNQIHITQLEGLDFLDSLIPLGTDVFIYADPPYVVQGDGLYLHAFDEAAHVDLANKLSNTHCPWMLTYDDDPRITDILYNNVRCARFPIAHTAHKQHIGTESAIYSDTLTVPDLELTRGHVAEWVTSP
ncbi:DNA adenine methylase [Corynebacterium amycolatum]|uniref:site-specific DNA-methyltransferase (adenine-specific) n=1 Tax=Corynebacterium amycolatum TaxID=43765 RepID=A0A7T4G5U5_CORAY|nr:DNA adenine methylase [Corynebacterium amycolatum]QQB82845.1 DNA adenine methylase [Corynebacterium amycolatum]